MKTGLATTAEVAAYLNVKPNTLDHWASSGEGPEYIKVNGRRRYDWKAVHRYAGHHADAEKPSSSPTGLFAVYEHVWTERYTNGSTEIKEDMLQEPVVSFDPDGYAMICAREGVLVRAADAGLADLADPDDGGELNFYWIKPTHRLTEGLDL